MNFLNDSAKSFICFLLFFLFFCEKIVTMNDFSRLKNFREDCTSVENKLTSSSFSKKVMIFWVKSWSFDWRAIIRSFFESERRKHWKLQWLSLHFLYDSNDESSRALISTISRRRFFLRCAFFFFLSSLASFIALCADFCSRRQPRSRQKRWNRIRSTWKTKSMIIVRQWNQS